MYKIYLRTHDQMIIGESKTHTKNQEAAKTAFAALVARDDLDGQRIAAVLSWNATRLAFHRFDRPAGENDNWRGRLNEIEWPGVPPALTSHGGARDGAGPKALDFDGGPTMPKTVSLDQATIDILTAYGDGKLSVGIRRAARAIKAGAIA